ncbi:MAG TPA: PQQ-binding-like beta-propeller repeat protein [Phycisphaerales bacterium]|nr:PQQ-binding-like beta-propeller repeat protein [Phycisphaerales bacterium]
MPAVPRTRARLAGPAALLAVLLTAPARAQENPVFLNDSTLAADVLAGLPGLCAAGNEGEAVRLLQRLLDEEADRLVVTGDDPALFESVRARVHRELLASEDLLDRYRDSGSARAAAMLADGDAAGAERTRLLTRPGFEAALHVAAEHLGAGRFESARLVLESLAEHPDRDEPALAQGAARLWSAVGAYLDRPAVREAAARWARGAGPEPAPEAIAWPQAIVEPAHSPETGGAVETGALVGTPLRSVDLQPAPAVSEPEESPQVQTRRMPALIEYPYIFPLVAGDTVYTTDGLWISAWDRFTLTPRWQVKPRGADNEREALEEQYAARAYRKRQSRDVEEAASLAVHGRLLLGATGLVSDGGRIGDPRLHALDRTTGRVLWSSYIDELDPQLRDASTRGPALFEGDVAVLAVRKNSTSRRFASAYLIGIDLADGSARWLSLAGSAGWLAYGGRGQWTDWPTLHEGVVYRVDEIGVICAVEAGTGRYRWVRRMPGVESTVPGQHVPWGASRPVIDGDTMIALSPDRTALLRIRLETGEILSRRSTAPFGPARSEMPAYIFRHGDTLVAVSLDRVATVPLAGAAESAPVDVSPEITEPGIIGRVVGSGDSLLLPLTDGLAVMPLDGLRAARAVELDASGNIVPLDNQLLAADNERLHSYLVWDRAAAILQERLDADPLDISTAVTFAELAYRAGRPESVLGPVDRALAAMGADPLGSGVRAGQRRLFGLMLEMLREQPAPGAPRNGLSPDMMSGIAERLGAVAVAPEERATHLLVLARVHLAQGEPGQAVADCQRVIADPTMASAPWGREASTVRAELEALARLDDALRLHGPELYEPFAAEARSRLDALRARAAPAPEVEALARAYPRAAAGAEAWLDAATLHEASGAALAADHALARAQAVLAAMRPLGLRPPLDLAGEVLGRRISSLLAHGRLDAAARELRAVRLDWTDLALTSGGEPLDLAQLAARLEQRLGARDARPLVRPPAGAEAILLEGWTLMRPLDRRDAFARRPGAMMLGPAAVALWEYDPESRALEPRWTFGYLEKPALVRFDPDRVLLYEPSDRGGALIALDPRTGDELWRTAALGEALAAAEGAGPAAGPERFNAPLDGPVSARDLLLALDETVIAAVSRSGRAVGFDAATGEALWSARTACHAVHDAAAGEGVLLLGGASTPPGGDQAGEPIALMLDLARGEEISRFTGAAGQVRWVKLAPEAAHAVVGLSQGLVGLSIPHGEADWVLTDPALEDSIASWSSGDRLFVQTAMLELATVNARTGELGVSRADVRGRLGLGGPIDLVALGEQVVVLSPGGCAFLDPHTGELLGADAVEQLGAGLAQPALAADAVVIFEREPALGSSGAYRFHFIETPSGRALASQTVRLPDAPRRVALLDGLLLVTTADSTVALPASGEP